MAMEQDSSEPSGIRDNSPRGNKEVARARSRKANAALQMKLAGATWDEIAEVVGYPTARQALVATERALEKELQSEMSQAKMRTLAGKRLEQLLRSCWIKAMNPDHPDHLLAVTKAREIVDRHAKLYGLDSPTELIVHSPSSQELEQWVASVVSVTAPQVDAYDIFEGELVDDEDDPPALAVGS